MTGEEAFGRHVKAIRDRFPTTMDGLTVEWAGLTIEGQEAWNCHASCLAGTSWRRQPSTCFVVMTGPIREGGRVLGVADTEAAALFMAHEHMSDTSLSGPWSGSNGGPWLCSFNWLRVEKHELKTGGPRVDDELIDG